MSQYFILILLIGSYPDGRPMIHPIPQMKLMSLADCQANAKITEEGVRAGMADFTDVQVQCVNFSTQNQVDLVQSLR